MTELVAPARPPTWTMRPRLCYREADSCGRLKFASFFGILLTLLTGRASAADWPWAGESTVDGFLAAERLDPHLALFKEILGVEDVLDFLFVEVEDVRGAMTDAEQRRFFRRVEHLRRWDNIQREYYTGVYPQIWQQWQEAHREEGATRTIGNCSSCHRHHSWLDAKVGMYLSFLDAAQYAMSESDRLTLRERRALQTAKMERAMFDAVWQRWRRTGHRRKLASTTVREMLRALELEAEVGEEDRDGEVHAENTEETRKNDEVVFECIDNVRLALRRASLGISPSKTALPELYFPSPYAIGSFVDLLRENLFSVFDSPRVQVEELSVRFLHGLCDVVVCEETAHFIDRRRWNETEFVCADNDIKLRPGSLIYATRILSHRSFSGHWRQLEWNTVSTILAVSHPFKR